MNDLSENLSVYLADMNWETGVTKHEQTHQGFLQAARLGVAPEKALEMVVGKIRESNGRLVGRDVVRQLKRSYGYVQGGEPAELPLCAIRLEDGRFKTPISSSFDFGKLLKRTECFRGGIDRNWFLERSPVRPGCAHEFLEALYRPNEKVVILKNMNERKPNLIWSHELPDFGQLASEEGVFFLPNPVAGERHIVERLKSETNPGGVSWRCEEAVTVFRYLLLESDHQESEYPGFQEAWLKFLALLPAPIVSIVGSGGKSVHALVRVDTKSKADWDGLVSPFKNALVEFGADRGAMTAVRLSRLPFGVRGARVQELYYCNPRADETPINQLLPRKNIQ